MQEKAKMDGIVSMHQHPICIYRYLFPHARDFGLSPSTTLPLSVTPLPITKKRGTSPYRPAPLNGSNTKAKITLRSRILSGCPSRRRW